jgi:hypothetical protein
MPTNCWEAMNCGRQPGGMRVHELGVCRASIASALNGVHRGQQGGRACWVQVGTLCGGKVQATHADKVETCEQCAFYATVKREEGDVFLDPAQLMRLLMAPAW